jgi:hypothetical protein
MPFLATSPNAAIKYRLSQENTAQYRLAAAHKIEMTD